MFVTLIYEYIHALGIIHMFTRIERLYMYMNGESLKFINCPLENNSFLL